MRFLADVNIAQSVITFLRQNGHDVLDAKKDYLTTADNKIILLAKQGERIIVTRDKDFLDLVQLPQYQVAAIVIRLLDQKPKNITLHLKDLFDHQSEEVLNTSLTIIKEESADSYPY
ncbi:MAG: hypothetical protein A3B41_04555 [Candidatus Levybacteria bacterium RIFCSPLOWO2_01_FULL_37_26]|nr:MAG: hypothetical protein A3B41_04555 [Candidatus Levybacteria bacterium RIFCSPLOWO2_01_FULL_37_26]